MRPYSWLFVCGACAVLLGAGRGCLALLVRRTPLYAPERWALGFLLGTAALSAVWIAGGPLYDRIPPVWVVSLLALVLMLSVHFRARDLCPAEDGAKLGWPDAALGLLLAAEFVVVLLIALRQPLGWDGIFNFEMKARLAFENTPSGRYPMAYLSDASRGWSHPEYPLLVPFAEWWIYTWLGRVDHVAVKILFPMFYFSVVAILWGAVRRMTNARVALATAVAIGLLPPLTLLPGATSGYAEVPLTAAILGAVSFVVLGVRTANGEALVLAGLLAAVATWTKAEGIVLAASAGVPAVAALLWTQRHRRVTVPLWQMTAPIWLPMVAVIPWLVTRQRYGMPPADFVPLTFGAIAPRLDRVATLAETVARELVRPGHWGLIWPVWGVAVLSMLASRTGRAVDFILVASVLLTLAAYIAALTLSAWPDPAEHARWAVPRLLVPLAPVGLVFIVGRLWADLAEAA